MTTAPPAASEYDLLDQTQYLATKIYDDPGADPTPLDLFSACAIGNYECVQDAINSGQDLNSRNKAGWTPLMYAAYVGHDTIVNLLLDSNANPSLGTPTNLTPLMVAAGCGNESVCYFLIQSDAEIDAQDSNGFTALLYAVRQGHQTVVQLLLETGADFSLTEKEKDSTALMLAALEGDEIIVDILVACGADLNAKDKDGHTARSLAFNKHHVRTVTLLDNAGFMYRRMSGSSATLEPPANEDEEQEREAIANDEGAEFEDSGDLFSGSKEFESYKQAQSVKKKILFNLGRRGGSRWSLPPQYMGSSMSSSIDEEEELEMVVDEKLVDLLRQLDLEKYVEVFQQQEIDFDSFLSFNDEDLKRIGIKLMGPRRKLSLAISEFKKQRDDEEERGEGVREEVEREKERERESRGSEDSRRVGRQASRPQLMKQPSTELTAAYRQAVETIEYLEKQLGQEHQLRKAADSYLLKLQTARQHTLASLDSVKDTQHNVSKHCKSVRLLGPRRKLSLAILEAKKQREEDEEGGEGGEEDNERESDGSGLGDQCSPGPLRPSDSPTLNARFPLTDTDSPPVKTKPTAWDLRGVEVCGEMTVVVHSSGAQQITWEGFGLKLHIDEGSLPAGIHQCTLIIRASLAGQYEFPDNSYLVSAIFWLRCEPMCKFTKPVTVEMQHCARSENVANHKLKFVRAVCSQKQLPYTFKELGGDFTSHSSYGVVEVNGFSGLAITQEGSSERNYLATLLSKEMIRSHPTRLIIEIFFVVICNTNAHHTVMQSQDRFKDAEMVTDQPIVFESDQVEFQISNPSARWKIMKLNSPVVRKEDVDCFTPSETSWIPYSHFKAKYSINDSSAVDDLECAVDIIGAKRPHNTLTIDISPEGPVTNQTPPHYAPASVTSKLSSHSLPVLLQQLSEHAASWRDIGTNLGFLQGELMNIQSNALLLTGSPMSWLRSMLSEWLQWAPGDGRGSTHFATLEKLKDALKQANLGATAHTLHL